MEEKPKRRRVPFRSRTFLVLAVVTSVVSFAWVRYQLGGMAERKARQVPVITFTRGAPDNIAPIDRKNLDWFVAESDSPGSAPAPLTLRLFGELGFAELTYFGSVRKISEAKRLYPEAN